MVKYDEKSCGIVLFRRENGTPYFLLLHYPGGHWDLAKGHVEGQESEKETALRELEEETGITNVDFFHNYREAISYKYFKFGKPSHKQVVFFLGETNQSDVTISHEHHDHIWLPFNEALEKLTFDNAKQLLKKANDLIS